MTRYFSTNASEIPGNRWIRARFYRGCANHCASVLLFFFAWNMPDSRKPSELLCWVWHLVKIGPLRLTSQPWSLLKPRRAPECLSAAGPRRDVLKCLTSRQGGRGADCTWTLNLSRTGVPPGTRREKNAARRVECNLSAAAFTPVAAHTRMHTHANSSYRFCWGRH